MHTPINSVVLCGCTFGTAGYNREKEKKYVTSPRVRRYTLNNEFHNFKSA
jgi:hypothetical protein